MYERKKTLHGFLWLLLEKLCALGGSAIVSIFLARHLEPDGFGLYSYVLSIAALLAPLSQLGLYHIVTKFLVNEPKREGQILGTVSLLLFFGALASTCLTAIWVRFANLPDPQVGIYIVACVAAGTIGAFEFLQYWFLAKSLTKIYATSRIVVLLSITALKIAMLFFGASLGQFLAVSALELALTGLRSLIAYRVVESEKPRWTLSARLARELLNAAWPTMIGALSAVVYLKVDTIMLAQIGTAKEAGIYSAAARLSEIWYFIPPLLLSAAFPSLLRIRATDVAQYEHRIQDLLDIMAVAGSLVAAATCAVAWVVIPLLFGQEYAGAVPILMIHVWAGIFIFMRAVLSKWLIAESAYILSLVTQTSGAVANVVLNMVLIPRYGGVGAAVATLISYTVASYLSLVFAARTRPMFRRMTLSLLWPLRIRRLGWIIRNYVFQSRQVYGP